MVNYLQTVANCILLMLASTIFTDEEQTATDPPVLNIAVYFCLDSKLIMNILLLYTERITFKLWQSGRPFF